MYSDKPSNNKFWTLLLCCALFGMVTGFAVPLAASYQPHTQFRPASADYSNSAVLQVVSSTVATPAPVSSTVVTAEDPELQKLAERNRRLEALVQTLRRKATAEPQSKTVHELGPQAEW